MLINKQLQQGTLKQEDRLAKGNSYVMKGVGERELQKGVSGFNH